MGSHWSSLSCVHRHLTSFLTLKCLFIQTLAQILLLHTQWYNPLQFVTVAEMHDLHSLWSSLTTCTSGVFLCYIAHLLMCRNTNGCALQIALCGGGGSVLCVWRHRSGGCEQLGCKEPRKNSHRDWKRMISNLGRMTSWRRCKQIVPKRQTKEKTRSCQTLLKTVIALH